jgi:amino acid transporter
MNRLDETPESLIRSLSMLGIALLMLNGMIGAGIFGLPQEAARLAGAWSPLVFLLCGVLIAPVMLTFAALASYFVGTGGPILYARSAFGALAGFQVGWAFYIARATALAANLNLLLSSATLFYEPADDGATRVVLLVLVCGGLTLVNVLGTRHAIGSVGALTVLKLLPLVALLVWGAPSIAAFATVLRDASAPTGGDTATALLLVMYAFVGFESALVPAGEARDPRRDIPRALLVTLAGVTMLYVAIQVVCVVVVPDLAGSERPVVDAATHLFGPVGAVAMTVGVVASIGGNVAGAMFSTPRMTYALAREGELPAFFAAVHPVLRTPHWSVIGFGAFVLVLAIAGSFVWLAATSVLVRLLIYLVCIAAVPRLRARHGDAPTAVRLPGGYTISAIAAGLCCWLLLQVSTQSVVATAVLLGVGLVLHRLARGLTARRA